MYRFSFSVNSDLHNISVILDHAEDLLSSLDLSREVLSDIQVAVDEVFSNIILHGYRNSPGRQVWIEMTVEDGQFRIAFQDDAPPYEVPSEKPALGKAILERKRPGVGFYLIRNLMDGLEYERKGMFNILTLTKRLFPGGGS